MALSTDRSIFQVAIMCALPLEADAVIAALDKVESNTAQKYGAAQEDSNSYTIGEMSGHPVVVVHFEGMGKVAAAKATANANHSFPNLKLVLLAGICGGVPVTPDGKQIYIGDLILSTSIKQYDFGRQLVGRFEAKRGADAINPRPLEGVRSLLKMLDTTHHRKTLQEDINATMDLLARQSTCYAWPDSDGRSYFPSHHHHKHSVVTTTADPCDCQTGGVCDIACKTSCVDLKCDSASMVVRCETCRSSRSTCRHDAQIMFGIVGTGDTVFKSGTHRDQESKSHNLIAFAMEAAGPWEYLPTIVVKAVCDYADGHKIKEWQHYAAGIAAAGVKAILKHWRRSEIPGQTQTSTPRKAIAVWPAVRKLNPHFTGRTEVLQNIKDIFLAHLHNPEPESLCCIVVAGLGGQGKSEICLHTALSMTKYFAGIFWVDVSSSEQALKGFERVASALGKDASDLQSYRDALDNWQERWLLILDNADELAEDYQGYMPCSSEGSVLISTRNSKCFCYASSSECAIELDGLADAEAELLLLRSTGQTGVVPEHVMLDVRMVNQLLTGHTLALLQAGALVRTGYCTLAEYPARYSEKKKDLMEYHPAQARSRHNDVYTTFEVSAVQLTKDAEDLLCMLAVLTCDPMPLHCFEIVRRAATEIIQGKLEYPDDVRNLTTQHTRRLIHSLGFERAETASGISIATRYGSGLASNSVAPASLDRLDRAVDLLCSLGIAKISTVEDMKCISMHPLTHSWAGIRQTSAQYEQSVVVAACYFSIMDLHHERIVGIKALKPHVHALSIQLSLEYFQDPLSRFRESTYYHLAHLALCLELVDTAQNILRPLIETVGPAFEQIDRHNVHMHALVVTVDSVTGQCEVALFKAQRIVEYYLAESAHPHDADYLRACVDLGRNCHQTWRLDEAEHYLEAVHEACRQGALVRGINSVAVKKYLAAVYIDGWKATRSRDLAVF